MSRLSKTIGLLVAIAALSNVIGLREQAKAQKTLPMSDLHHQTLILEDGDGDPDWLHERHFVDLASSDGFSGLSGGWYGEALLFRVLGPRHEGELIALTPRTIGGIEEQLLKNKVASVIVHRFDCDEKTLRNGEACKSVAVGMTILREPDKEANES